jgi:hypothetical protein
MPAAIVAAICVASIFLSIVGNRAHDRAVVVVPEVRLREGNGEAFATVGVSLQEGTTCGVVERRGDWFNVDTPAETGWVHNRDIELVPATPTISFSQLIGASTNMQPVPPADTRS